MKFPLSLLLLFLLFGARAQIIVTPGVSAAALVSGFAGNGLSISNMTINCPGNAYGTFSNGSTTNISLNNGAIFTTGSATGVIGPNNTGSFGTCNNVSSGDPSLVAIEPQAVNDYCGVEFDIVPQCNQLVLRFVFGSEEYPEFVNASFNDAFGFFITGPGPACQPNYYNGTNVATLPNNTTPVSINNVNAGNNSAYYVNNAGGSTIQYDGFTTVLTRTIAICPCQSYHFKIAIADAGDCYYDSGVLIDFLQCNQFMASTMSSTPSGCGTNNGTASVTMTNGVGPFTYSWSPSGGNGTTASGLSPGVYTVTVNDAVSCSPPYTNTVLVNGPSSPTLAVNTISVACNGGATGSATVAISGGVAPYTYTWTPSGGNAATATGLSAGNYTITVRDNNSCVSSKTLNIAQPTALNTTTAVTNPLCNGGTGSATITASGGTTPYAYSWSNGNTSATPAGLLAGVYTATVTDANNCKSIKSATISQPSALSATFTQTNVLCNGGTTGVASVTVSGGTGGYTYTWSPTGGNTSTATGLATSVYSLTVKDANNCTITRTVSITQPPALTANTSQTNISCFGASTGVASVSVTGGNGAYTYTWVPSGGNAASATSLAAGNYTVNVKDANNCPISRTLTLTQPPASTLSVSSSSISCNGGTGSATVSVTGGTSPFTYTWSPSGGNANVATGLSAGTYSISVTDNNTCPSVATVSIAQPTALNAIITGTNVLCFGNTNGAAAVNVTGGTGPYSYTWSPSGGNVSTASSLGAANYTVNVRDANNCSVTRTVTITQPSSLTAVTSQTNAICGNPNAAASVSVTGGTGAYTYTWTPSGGNAASANGLAAGNYTVTVKDANNCSISNTFTLTQAPGSTLAVSASSISCNGGTGSATVSVSGGTSPFTYTWSPSGGNAAVATGLSAGIYSISVTDNNTCVSSTTVNIAQPTALNATTTQTNVLCNGNTTGSAAVNVSGGTIPYTYTWSPSGGNASSATGLSAGAYTVNVKDANNCSLTRTLTITQPASLTVVTSQTNAICGNPNGVAVASVAGGTGTYTYTWSPSGGNASSATGLAAGNYTVTINDANACAQSANVTITQSGQFTLSVNSTSIACNGGTGSATVNVSGGTPSFSYTWSPTGGNAAVASGLSAGNYTVTVSDAIGCPGSATVNIAQPSALSAITTQTNVLCNGNANGSAAVSVTGGMGAYTYTWSPSGGNAAVATGLMAGSYTVTSRDANSCSIIQALTITQPPVLSGTTSQNTISCNGGTNGSAGVTMAGGVAPYSYTWSPVGGNAATATGLGSGNYTLSVKDNNLCSASYIFFLAQPPALSAALSTTSVSCFGQSTGSATLTAGGGTPAYSYTWTPTGGNATTATSLAAGNYSVILQDANGCALTRTLTISQPPLLASTVSQNSVTCAGYNNGTATVSATGGTTPYSYSWTPTGSTSATLTSLAPGNYSVTVKDANQCISTNTLTIATPGAYTLSVSTGSVLCNAQSTGSATVTVGGNTPAYTYTWVPSGGNGPIASALAAGNYTISILDANLCPTNRTLTIAQPSALTGSISSSPAHCGNADGSATVTVNGGAGSYTYTWTPTGGNAAASTGISTGQYTCSVSDLNNCRISLSISVAVINPSVTLSASQSSICAGNSTTLSATGSTSYTWNPSGSLTSATGSVTVASPTISTTYTVTGANPYGCTVTNTIAVQMYPNPSLLLTASSITLCAGNTVSLTAAGAVNYTWSPATGLSNVFASNPTTTLQNSLTYSATGTNGNGCSDTKTITLTVLPLPIVTASASSPTICLDEPTMLTAAGATSYVWNTGSASNPLTVSPASSTSYTVTGTDANGCKNTASVSVTVNNPPTVSVNASTVICAGETVTLNASGATTYTWNTGATGSTLNDSPLSNTNYTVTGTDVNGCKDTAYFSLTVYTTPTLSISGKQEICENDMLTLTASGGNGYTWNTGDNTSSITYAYSTGAIVSVSSGTAPCIGNTSFSITVDPLPVVSATATPAAIIYGQNSQITSSSNGSSYNWVPSEGLSCITCPNPVAQPSTTTAYTVEVTDGKGCKNTTVVVVNVDLVCGELFAPTAFSPNNDGNNDTWCVYGNCIEFIQCEIFNRWGQKVYTLSDKDQCWDGIIGGVMQNPGVFIFQVQASFINGDHKTLKGNFTLVK